MKYNEIDSISSDSYITFKEYDESKRGRKLTLTIECAKVLRIVRPNEGLSIDELLVVYGNKGDEQDYLALSSVNYYRIIAQKQINPNEDFVTFVIGLNESYMNSGLQEIEIVQPSVHEIQINPNNLLKQESSLGYGSYEVGQGFKNIKKVYK